MSKEAYSALHNARELLEKWREGFDIEDFDIDVHWALEDITALLRKEYERGYADAMDWKMQNHLEHLPSREKKV